MDGVVAFQSDSMPETFQGSVADFDLMDELLSGGCWLESADGSNFPQQPGPSTSAALFDSSNFLPALDFNHSRSNPVSSENDEEGTRASTFPEKPSPAGPPTENPVGAQSLNQSTVGIPEDSGQFQRYPAEGSSELVRRWWIGPRVNQGPPPYVRERLIQALRYIREFTKDRDTLVQIWVPMRIGARHVLSTDGQPFYYNSNCQRLAKYRDVSVNYQFSAEMPGLPGRVFLGKVPEWTPDVQFFRSDEYPRVPHAQKYNVRGSFGLPIFERSSQTCLGVVEVLMTTQKINYRPELDSVRKALEAVDLRSSEVAGSSHEQVNGRQAHKKSYEAVLPEIQEVLKTVCETHGLPLAQTWVPCIQQGKGGCRHSDDNFAVCVSTEDSACYVSDHKFFGFHEACSEHHLFRGQGVAGKAFMTNQPCFSSDITTFSKAEYPLLHYAKMFQLQAAVAIRLRSIYTGTTDYVLEFFLPVACLDTEDQKMMLNSLSMVIKRVCWSLRVLTDKEVQEEPVLHIGEVGSSKGKLDAKLPKLVSNTKGSPYEEPSWISNFVVGQQKSKTVPLEFQKEKPTEEFKVTSHWDNPGLALQKGKMLSKQHHLDTGSKSVADCAGVSSYGRGNLSGAGKTGEKRRTKAEKTISLQVLRQYFAGSLKDAAKNIGVCPTTLKRICRQHGITRWPSRKIKKVGHSLRKLQVVIDSVQCAESAFPIGSFYASFPDLTSPKSTGTSPFSTSKTIDNPNPLNMQPKGVVSPQPARLKSPSSSFSQTSSPNLCCSSSGITNQLQPTHHTGREDASMAENSGALKRACGDAELHVQSQEEPRVPVRSENRKSLGEYHNVEGLPPLLKNSCHVSRDDNSFRVKVTYGEEKIRFSMQSTWHLKELQQEVARRFNIDDINRIDLKYLDDDSEWVLLTCDADLDECAGIYKSFRTRAIKLSVHQSSHPNLGSSLGSSVPS